MHVLLSSVTQLIAGVGIYDDGFNTANVFSLKNFAWRLVIVIDES